MNVLYQCPVCGSRLFAPPGGTNLKCPHHTETKYEQVEKYQGPDFKFKDPDQGKNLDATGIVTPEARNITPVHRTVKVVASQEEIMSHLHARYEKLYRRKADKRFGEKRLRALVKRKEEELEAKTKAEFAAKKEA